MTDKDSKAHKVEGIVLKDVRLANAVQVGRKEVTFVNDSKHDIRMFNNLIISITSIPDKGSTIKPETVYTTVMNCICWHK